MDTDCYNYENMTTDYGGGYFVTIIMKLWWKFFVIATLINIWLHIMMEVIFVATNMQIWLQIMVAVLFVAIIV